MKTLKIMFVFLAAFLISASIAFAQVTETAQATVTVLTPISIDFVSDMNFGWIATNGTIGTVVLTPLSERTATGGVTFLPSQPGTITAATFTVNGLAGATYSITLPEEANTVANGGNNFTVDAWTSNPTPTGTLTGGTQTLTIGATLNVTDYAPFGVYTSVEPFPVTVNYN